jgi:hypothetical protein
MKFRFLISLLIIFSSCTNKDFVQPNKFEINQIVKAVMDNDSINFKYQLFNKLRENRLSVEGKDYLNRMQLQYKNSVDFNELINNLSHKDKKNQDSLFILHQINTIKNIPVDSNLSNKIKLSNFTHDYKCYVFYAPILSFDMNKAYIQYFIHLDDCNSFSRRLILEKINNNWTVKKSL